MQPKSNTNAFTFRGSKLVQTVPDRELNETTVGRTLNHWMDETVKDAMKQGEFDHLPGKGKPLGLTDSDPYAGGEAEAYRILKNAGFTPEWVELRKQISEAVAWLRANPKHPERPSRIVEANILIDRHNRQIPNGSLAFPKLPRTFGQG